MTHRKRKIAQYPQQPLHHGRHPEERFIYREGDLTFTGEYYIDGKYIKKPLPNSYWVLPGQFAAGEYPGARNPDEAASKLRTLLEAGFDHFIDLTEDDEWLEPYTEIAASEARRLSSQVTHERHAIVDARVPASPQAMAAILDAIDNALAAGRTVYVHCWGGVGRTGTVVGCWLVRRGRSGDEALQRLAGWWQTVEKVRRQPRSPETAEQHEYVRTWQEPSREEDGTHA